MSLTYQPFNASEVINRLPLPPVVNIGHAERVGSIVGGIALAVAGWSHRSLGGTLLGLLGGAALIYRGSTGHCQLYSALDKSTVDQTYGVTNHQGIKVEETITINRHPGELFTYWRHFENLGNFMSHVKSVRVLDQKRSHWKVKAPAGQTVQWNAEIVNEHPNEMIAWQSLPGADVQNAGTVRFTPTEDGLATRVRVVLEFHPPAGALGALVAKIFGEAPDQQIREDLGRFKELMERGNVPAVN